MEGILRAIGWRRSLTIRVVAFFAFWDTFSGVSCPRNRRCIPLADKPGLTEVLDYQAAILHRVAKPYTSGITVKPMIQDKLQGSVAIELIYLQSINGIYEFWKRNALRE
jgi:hypothetical protein